jgi:hypothetical protein
MLFPQVKSDLSIVIAALAAAASCAALAIPRSAHAADLAEGVFGVKWGYMETFSKPEGFASCSHRTQREVEWECYRTLGEVPVKVAFMWAPDHKQMSGVFIFAEGHSNCGLLMDTLTVAWGNSKPTAEYLTGKMDDRTWLSPDRSTLAAWSWSSAMNECTVFAFSRKARDASEADAKRKAAEAAEGL